MTNETDKPGVRGFFKRLRAKLNQGPAWLTTDLTELLPGRKIDAEILDDLETRLITADVGAEATGRISPTCAGAWRARNSMTWMHCSRPCTMRCSTS